MVFEIKDNEQSMDVLKYIVEKDYDCDIGISISYVKAEIDAKNELNHLIEESHYGLDDTMEECLKYTNDERKEIDNYILENTVESITLYNYDDYQIAIQEDLLHYMREYFKRHKR